jgi:hypothetical protein
VVEVPGARAGHHTRPGRVGASLVVLDGYNPVGIVSIGDLAIERDAGSALAEISSAAPST